MTEPAHEARSSIAAIVLVFGPCAAQLNRLIGALVMECRQVYVMDNGGGQAALAVASEAGSAVQLVDLGGNQGIGEALNQGVRLAAAAGFEYVTTFDQDSEPAAGQISALIGAFEELRSTGANVAAVGPRIVDLRGGRGFEHPFMRRTIGWPTAVHRRPDAKYVAADFLITSGAVISLAAHARVGPYDPGLFVDYTDMEWCFRALALGYHLFGICSVTMPHQLSAGAPATALGMTILEYSPVRRYYYARNVVLLAQRSYVAAGWKARMLIGLIGRVVMLPLVFKFSRGWTDDWLMLVRGIIDGVMGTGGAYSRPR